MVLLLPESVLMSMAYATTKGHGDDHSLCFSLNPNKSLWAVLSLGVSVESVLPPKAMLLHEVWAVSEDLAYVHSLTTAGDYVCDLCCHQKPYGGPWFMWSLTVKSTEATFAMILMSVDAWLRGTDMEGLCNNPQTQDKLDRKPPKGTLTMCEGVAEEWLSTIDGFWQRCGRKRTQFFLRGRLLRAWPCSSEYTDNPKWTFLFIFCLFWFFLYFLLFTSGGGVTKGVDMKGL